MRTAALRTSRSWARAAVPLIAAAIAIGCAPVTDQDCTPEEQKPAPPRAPSAEPTTRPGPPPRVVEGADAPPFTVTVANAAEDRVIAVDAVHGSLDEPLVLVAATGEAASDGAKQPVTVALSDAFLGGEPKVRLHLVDAYSGDDVKSIAMKPGQQAFLRLAGEGFARDATYRSSLTIFGAEPAVYHLRIRSTAPHRPLGLRAAKLSETWANVPLLERKAVSVILPVDSPGDSDRPYHVAVRPPTETIEGAKPLPACGITARRLSRDDAVLLSLPPLEPGHYAGVIEIQGEPLAVDIMLKNGFWWVWLFVAAGAGLSLGLREYVRYRAAREATERKITAKEREIDKKREALLTWDELNARNVLRRARGEKSYFGIEDVDEILLDATPRERAERSAIETALNDTALPTLVRAKLRERFERLSYLCSHEDTRALDAGLAELAAAAQTGFSPELQAWLGELHEVVQATQARIAPLLEDPKLKRDARGVEQVKIALRSFALLVADARALRLEGPLSTGQAEVLSSIAPALALIEAEAREHRVPADIVALIHCDFRSLAAAREGVPAPAPATTPAGLRVRARGAGPALNVHEEITFELALADGALEDAALYEPPHPIAWWIDGVEVVPRGGFRLTYVFPMAGLWSLRPRRVEVRVQKRTIAVWQRRVLPAERSVAFVERVWASGARLGATLVGVIVTGAAAVALYWSGKAFGGWTDYIASLMTGLGADLTVVAGGGKLLQSILSTLQKRAED